MGVCNSDTGRFEGTLWACVEEEEGLDTGLSFCDWGWGFDVRMGMSRATGSVVASWSCEKTQVVRLQCWTSGHFVFLNSPRLENMTDSPQTLLPTIKERDSGKFNLRSRSAASRAKRHSLVAEHSLAGSGGLVRDPPLGVHYNLISGYEARAYYKRAGFHQHVRTLTVTIILQLPMRSEICILSGAALQTVTNSEQGGHGHLWIGYIPRSFWRTVFCPQRRANERREG